MSQSSLSNIFENQAKMNQSLKKNRRISIPHRRVNLTTGKKNESKSKMNLIIKNANVFKIPASENSTFYRLKNAFSPESKIKANKKMS